MAQHFTWQQFLIAAMVFTFVWYIGIVLLFYRKELRAFLGERQKDKNNSEPLPHRWESGVDNIEDAEESNLLGAPKLPEGIEIVKTEDFSFARDTTKDDKIGLVPDVLEEIKKVFQLLIANDGNKQDFFKLMVEVKEGYPKIGSNPNIGQVNEYIIDHAPFHLTKDELENIWY